MALPNPTINPPRLASDQTFLHSRSPSRSPTRSRARDVDPLLRDLSPGKTLRAFTSQDRTRNDALAKSIEAATHSQRTLGVKVAQACKDLKTWTRELEGWQWPGTFDTPEPARKKQRMSSLTVLSNTGSTETSTEREEEFWGSLPSHAVRTYEKRVEEICVSFDAIDLEELKSFVLAAHSRAGKADASIDDSIGAIGAATDLKSLDDFTALITATILQALPFLPRLTRLLDTWTIRLSILRSTPAYLRDLKQARTDLDHGWAALAVSPSLSQASFTSDNLDEMKNVISTEVYSLGKRLDRFLDMLEGRHEVVPDAWIDDFEDLEQEYGEWVVKAERKVLEGEWKNMKARVKDTALTLAKKDEESERHMRNEEEDVDEEVPRRDIPTPIQPRYETTTITSPTVTSTTTSRAGGGSNMNSSTHTTTAVPVVTSTSSRSAGNTRTNTSTYTTTTGPITTTSSTRNIGNTSTNTSMHTTGPMTTTTSARSIGNAATSTSTYTTGPMTTTTSTRNIGNTATNTSMHTTSTGPLSTTVTTVITGGKSARPVTTTNTEISRSASSPERLDNAASAQPRHVPIMLDYSNPDHPFDANALGSTTNANQDTTLSRANSKTPSETTNGLSVKKRAAFLNSDIERSDSLLKTKSAPIVRPFEHASNAFSRLFKREGHSEEHGSVQTRSVTEGSKRNVEKSSDEGSGRSSQLSGAVSSIKTSASANKNRNMEYGDMVRMPERPKVVEKPRGRDRTEKGDVGSRMQYADLPMAIMAEPRVKEMPSKDTISKESKKPRKSEESKRSRAGTLERDTKRMVSADLVSSAGRKSEETKRSKVGTPKKEVPEVESREVNGIDERQSIDETRRIRPTTPKDTKKMQSADLVDVDGRRSLDESARARPKIPSRNQSQDLTALPNQYPEELKAISENVVPETYKPESRAAPQTYKPKMVAAPETYRPSGLSSPFRSRFQPEQEQPAVDWPLSASATPDERSPDGKEYFSHPTVPPRSKSAQDYRRSTRPLESHDFEEFFVMTMPDRPGKPSASSPKVAERDFGQASPITRPKSAPGHKRSKSGSDRSSLKSAGSGTRSRRLDLPDAILPRPVSVVEEEDFVDPEDSANNAAAYFGGQGSQRFKPKPPVSPGVLKLTTPETVPEAPDESGIVRRASTASIESYSPSKLRSVEISRRASISEINHASQSEPQTPKKRDSAEGEAGSPLNYNGTMVFPSPPSVPPRRSSVKSNSSSAKSDSIMQRWSASSSLPEDVEPDASLNSVMSKQRKGKEVARSGDGKNTLTRVDTSSTDTGQDNFDRHVSEVLDRVHAPIRFKTRPGAVTPVAKGGVEQKMKARAERQGKNMTLAPAEQSPKKASGSDPEVKLYHLTQVGRAEPIKLYVRLVGEGERVMVRVGGGWADLADYLRQYAEHHGSRTVSEGTLELQTATASGSREANGAGKRTFSGPAVVPEPKSRTPITPTSGKFAAEKPSVDSLRMKEGGGWDKRPSRPRLWLGDSDDEEQTTSQAYLEETPRSAASRPSTADAFGRPDSRKGIQDGSSPIGPGLDGQVKGELPEQKARWVEGMIEKAMKSATAASASAEKTREENPKYFGDMGKVGGTRRVVFRSASGSEGAK